jgi:hypothetical protein
LPKSATNITFENILQKIIFCIVKTYIIAYFLLLLNEIRTQMHSLKKIDIIATCICGRGSRSPKSLSSTILHRERVNKVFWEATIFVTAQPTSSNSSSWLVYFFIDHARGLIAVIPRFEIAETKPPYVCPRCSFTRIVTI